MQCVFKRRREPRPRMGRNRSGCNRGIHNSCWRGRSGACVVHASLHVLPRWQTCRCVPASTDSVCNVSVAITRALCRAVWLWHNSHCNRWRAGRCLRSRLCMPCFISLRRPVWCSRAAPASPCSRLSGNRVLGGAHHTGSEWTGLEQFNSIKFERCYYPWSAIMHYASCSHVLSRAPVCGPAASRGC